MPNILRLKQNESINSVLLRPMEQPPEGGYSLDEIHDNKAWFESDHDTCWTTPLTHPSGKYAVKETWCYNNYEYNIAHDLPMEYLYHADYDSLPYKKRSCRTMPIEAVRYWVDVETSVRRVQDIKEISIKKFGLVTSEIGCESIHEKAHNAFINHYNSLYAKPIKNKAGDGYVCYPYDDSRLTEDYSLKYDMRNGRFYHKGLPLTICPNPFIQVLKCRKAEKNK